MVAEKKENKSNAIGINRKHIFRNTGADRDVGCAGEFTLQRNWNTGGCSLGESRDELVEGGGGDKGKLEKGKWE